MVTCGRLTQQSPLAPSPILVAVLTTYAVASKTTKNSTNSTSGTSIGGACGSTGLRLLPATQNLSAPIPRKATDPENELDRLASHFITAYLACNDTAFSQDQRLAHSRLRQLANWTALTSLFGLNAHAGGGGHANNAIFSRSSAGRLDTISVSRQRGMRGRPEAVHVMTRQERVNDCFHIGGDPTSLFQLDVAHTNPHKMSSGTSIFYVARRTQDRQLVMVNVLSVTEKPPILDFISASHGSSHPNVLSFIEFYVDLGPRRWLVLDYMRGDWLNNVISRNTMEEEHVARVTADVCAGLVYLHNKGIIMRAVKSEGMFLTREGVIKICDFENVIDLKASLREGTSHKLVSPHWMPPEVARSNAYGFKTDSWGVGILILEMLDKVPPHFHEVPQEVLRRIKTDPTPALTNPLRLTSVKLQGFLVNSLCLNPSQRLYVVDLLKHEFLQVACPATNLIPFLRHKFRPVSLDNNGPKDLTGKVTRRSVFADVHGGFSDVWVGSYDISDVPGSNKSIIPVAIKVLRSVTPDPEMHRKIQKRLNRELTVWSVLRHPNIIELYGTCSNMGPYSAMVSPWFPKGSAPQFLKSLGRDATLFVRLRLLSEVAAGLDYLHRFTPTVVHGDIKGANILISGEGEACLCDFGLSAIAGEVAGSSNFTSTFAGSLRWTAPELIRPSEEAGEAPQVTTWSDIYALGSVTYEILTGLVPYHTRRTDIQVMFDVLKHQLPKRPSTAEAAVTISDTHWNFIQSCWRENPLERPPISIASPALEAMYCDVIPP